MPRRPTEGRSGRTPQGTAGGAGLSTSVGPFYTPRVPKGLLGWLRSGRAREEDDRREAELLSPGALPGVTVYAASAVAELRAGGTRGGVSCLGPFDPSASGDGNAWAGVVLSGGSAGEVFLATGGALDPPAGVAVLLDGARTEVEDAPGRIGRETLSGSVVPGVTGARLLWRSGARAVLRLGPPPAARWAVEGLRSVAVLAGKLTLVDGEEACDVRAGEVAFVAEPAATLHVQAGNDAAVAIGFGVPGLSVRLG